MVNTVPARVQLGASTVNRDWYLDVYDPNSGAFIGVFGIQEFKAMPADPTLQEDSDFDGGGFKSSTTTAQSWGATAKLGRKVQGANGAAYDPGQEILRKAAKGIGTANRVQVRIYEMTANGPRVEAYQGYVTVGWSPDGGGMDALSTVSLTLTGQGAPVNIVHPTGDTAVPVITNVAGAVSDPAATGATIIIKGAYFTGTSGATGVKIGGTNATSYRVIDDSTISAVLPSGAAGSAPVVVGTSQPYYYTRAA